MRLVFPVRQFFRIQRVGALVFEHDYLWTHSETWFCNLYHHRFPLGTPAEALLVTCLSLTWALLCSWWKGQLRLWEHCPSVPLAHHRRSDCGTHALGSPQPCCKQAARNLASASSLPLSRCSFEAGKPIKWGYTPDLPLK